MNRQSADAFDSFEADDNFLDASQDAPEDPFLDAEAIERRLLGEAEPAPRASPADEPHRPFGARLADANADAESFEDEDPFGDANGAAARAFETKAGDGPFGDADAFSTPASAP
ncbi:MAG: hypothetical protein ACOC20_05230 [Oceanicaulis sp.]